MLNVAAVPVPVPLIGISCGLLTPLSVTFNAPVIVVEVVGLKLTLIVQVVPAARLAEQLFVWAKLPPATIPAMLKAAEPLLDKVIA